MRQSVVAAYLNNRRRRKWRRTVNPETTPENELQWDDGTFMAWDGVGTDEPVLIAWDS